MKARYRTTDDGPCSAIEAVTDDPEGFESWDTLAEAKGDLLASLRAQRDGLNDAIARIKNLGVKDFAASAEAERGPTALHCEMTDACREPVTMLDRKGYVYCTAHGLERRGVHPCRKLLKRELRQLESGEALRSYSR